MINEPVAPAKVHRPASDTLGQVVAMPGQVRRVTVYRNDFGHTTQNPQNCCSARYSSNSMIGRTRLPMLLQTN